jgi:hypothetical protein
MSEVAIYFGRIVSLSIIFIYPFWSFSQRAMFHSDSTA